MSEFPAEEVRPESTHRVRFPERPWGGSPLALFQSLNVHLDHVAVASMQRAAETAKDGGGVHVRCSAIADALVRVSVKLGAAYDRADQVLSDRNGRGFPGFIEPEVRLAAIADLLVGVELFRILGVGHLRLQT